MPTGKPNPLTWLRRHPRTRAVLLAIGMLAFWFVFKVLDPVSLETATKESSAQFFSGLTATFHGWRADPAQRHIAVVEVTDDTLAAFHHAWPLSYDQHARVIESIIENGATAVLVDIRFAMERDGESLHAFDDAIRMAAERHIPLLFSKGAAGDGYGDLPAPLTQYQAITGWEAAPGSYPLLVADATAPGGVRRTAAFDLYARLCSNGALPGCTAPIDDHDFAQPLALRWGTHFDPLQRRVSDVGACAAFGDDGLSRLGHAGLTAVLSLFGATRSMARQPCFYALTLGAEQLHRVDAQGQPLGRLLANRAVFYGGDMRGDHDTVDVPVLGQVPGVHAHAMAFDNLMTYGRDYFREPREVFDIAGHAFTQAEALEFAAWLIMIFIASIRVTHSRNESGAPPPRTRRAVQAIVIAAGGAAYCADLLQRGSLFGAGQLGLIYLLGLAVLLAGYATRRRMHESFWGKLLQVLCVVVVVFTLNELLFRWPGADWFGLVLLWFALGESIGGEEDGFVPTVVRELAGFIASAQGALHRHRRRLAQHAKSISFGEQP